MKAHVLPLLAKLRTLLRVAVVTYVIVGNQLEYKANDSFMFRVPPASGSVNLSFCFLHRQKCFAHDHMDQIRDQRPKAYIREKMIGHVDSVIAVE